MSSVHNYAHRVAAATEDYLFGLKDIHDAMKSNGIEAPCLETLMDRVIWMITLVVGAHMYEEHNTELRSPMRRKE